MLLLAAGAAPTSCLRRRRLQPGRRVPRRADRDARPAARRQQARATTSRWPLYGYSPTRRHYLAGAEPLRPPFKRTLVVGRARCSSSRPCSPRASCSCSRTTARSTRSTSAPARSGLAPRPGPARRLLPRLRDGRIYVTLLQRDRQSKDGRVAALRAKDGKAVVQAAAEPHRVLAAVRRRAPLLRLRGRHGLRAAAPTTASVPGATRRPARSRAGWRSPTASSTSATTAAASTRSAQSRRRQVWSVGDAAARASASAPATSTPRRPSPTAASTSATPTATSTRSRPRPASSPGARAPAATSTRRPPSRRCRAASRRSSSAPTTRASTRSTPAPARCAGRTRRRAGSPAPRPWSATSSTSPTSSRAPRPGSAPAPAARSSASPRRLQPRHLRRALPLPGRLRVAVAAQAEDGALSARTGTPAAARWRLASATV